VAHKKRRRVAPGCNTEEDHSQELFFAKLITEEIEKKRSKIGKGGAVNQLI